MKSVMKRSRARRTALLLSLVVAGALSVGCSGQGARAGDQTATASADATQEAAPTPDGSTIVADGGGLPNGVYRVEFSDKHLSAHGLDALAIENNGGTWTHTLEDGHWTVEQVTPDFVDRFEGIYQVSGDELFWQFHDTSEVLHVRWSTDDAGDLHFTQATDSGPVPDFQFALPWTRVG